MNALISLLLSSVSLSWVQPPNPGWADPCGPNPCLQNYTVTDAPSYVTYTVPFGLTNFSIPATPGVHTYSIVLNGINAAGTAVSSTPPATTTVTVHGTICHGTVKMPVGTIKAGGQSVVVMFPCAGALATDQATFVFPGQPTGYAGFKAGIYGRLDIQIWPSAGQLNLQYVNYTGRPFVVTAPLSLNVADTR
jgi:hypothetical protein